MRPNLCHFNRLPNYTDYGSTNSIMPFRVNNPWQPNELLDAVMVQPLKFEPGSRYEYTYTNYVILGIILEKVSGEPFGDCSRMRLKKSVWNDIIFALVPKRCPSQTVMMKACSTWAGAT